MTQEREINLPPLPESDGENDIYGEANDYYYGDKMQSYARAAVEADRRQRHLKERAQLDAEWIKVRELQQAYQRQQWRPIESAPHNEEVLLGWRDWDGAWMSEVGMASWGWRNEHVSNMSQHGRATHWQPLPIPPEES